MEIVEPLNNLQRESADRDGFLARTLRFVSGTRDLLLRTPAKNPRKWDIVLLGGSGVETTHGTFSITLPGGFMGSIFSSV